MNSDTINDATLNIEEINAIDPRDGDLPSSMQGRVLTMLEERLGRDITHAEFERIILNTIKKHV
jgi:hypothetical protein